MKKPDKLPADPQAPIVATLFLPTLKVQRPIKILGRSGMRYMFLPEKGVRCSLVRAYTDIETFEKEAEDIAKSTRNSLPVAVKLGTIDLVGRANDALRNLISKTSELSAANRLHALQEIAGTVQAAIEELSHVTPLPPSAPPEQAPFVPAPDPTGGEIVMGSQIEDLTLNEDPLMTGAPKKITATPIKPLDEEALMNMPFEELRAMASAKGITERSRVGIVREMLGTP